MFAHGRKDRLTEYDLGRFPGDSLFDRLARAVCRAGCLPRKELYEAWEVARRVRRRMRGGRVVDLAAGHGLLAHVLLLLDDTSPEAIAVDTTRPPCAVALHDALIDAWPRLAGRVTFVEAAVETVALAATDVVVSSHACGALTDVVLDRAAAAGARVAVLPCCHDVDTCDAGPLTGWMAAPLAIDARRAMRLEARGYRVRAERIPDDVTPKNRLLLAEPAASAALTGSR
ncbi:MAG: methyltransferase [Vicinamibacteria bacterium]